MVQTATQPVVLVARAGEGDARWWWGNLAESRLGGGETNGGLNRNRADAAARTHHPPPHVRHREEETFLVTKGHLSFKIGEQTVEADPGDRGRSPPRPSSLHGRTGRSDRPVPADAVWLEGLVREQSVPAARREPPAPSDVPAPNLAHMGEVAARYGCELLM